MNIEQYEKEAWFKKFNPKKIEVEAITLNDFVEKHSISVSIIKIDVEGAEDKVIEGSLQLLNTQQPFIVMEYLEPSRHNKTHRKAVELLQNSNYQAYSINKTGDLIPCNNIEQYLANQKLDSDNIVFKKML